ncbi:MAG: hypothetical protein Q4B58_03895 [Bacteroidales bacterium]|nr:hypothetical protein [Bacteroidales bacterium]
MNPNTLSKVALWVLFIGSLVSLVLFNTMGTTAVETASGTQAVVQVPNFLDGFIFWADAVVILALALLVIFAIKTVASDPKGAVGGIIGIALFALLLVVCFFASGETQDFTRIVNGETQVIELFWMKAIDMWCYSIFALIGITVALIVLFPILRAIKVIK